MGVRCEGVCVRERERDGVRERWGLGLLVRDVCMYVCGDGGGGGGAAGRGMCV